MNKKPMHVIVSKLSFRPIFAQFSRPQARSAALRPYDPFGHALQCASGRMVRPAPRPILSLRSERGAPGASSLLDFPK